MYYTDQSAKMFRKDTCSFLVLLSLIPRLLFGLFQLVGGPVRVEVALSTPPNVPTDTLASSRTSCCITLLKCSLVFDFNIVLISVKIELTICQLVCSTMFRGKKCLAAAMLPVYSLMLPLLCILQLSFICFCVVTQ